MCYFTFHCLSKFYAQLFGGVFSGGFPGTRFDVFATAMLRDLLVLGGGRKSDKTRTIPKQLFLGNAFFFFF